MHVTCVGALLSLRRLSRPPRKDLATSWREECCLQKQGAVEEIERGLFSGHLFCRRFSFQKFGWQLFRLEVPASPSCQGRVYDLAYCFSFARKKKELVTNSSLVCVLDSAAASWEVQETVEGWRLYNIYWKMAKEVWWFDVFDQE